MKPKKKVRKRGKGRAGDGALCTECDKGNEGMAKSHKATRARASLVLGALDDVLLRDEVVVHVRPQQSENAAKRKHNGEATGVLGSLRRLRKGNEYANSDNGRRKGGQGSEDARHS